MPSPSINAFLVVADYEDEGWRIDQQVKQKLIDKLDAGLESNNPDIFKLAVEVKLAKRLNNFVRIDDKLEVDNSYITFSEYQLFLIESGYKSLPNRQNLTFNKGTAKNIIDGIKIEDANYFCYWLSLRDRSSQLSDKTIWYRLLTPKEQRVHNIPENKKTAIRLVRCKLPSKYNQLAEYLIQSEWKKSDEETFKLMLQVAVREKEGYLDANAMINFPCEDLCIIDTLWVSASNGNFGFSIQKEIYQSVGGKRDYNDKIWIAFSNRIGWMRGSSFVDKLTYDLNAPIGHLPKILKNNRKYFDIYNLLDMIENIALFSRAETCRL